ncbi:chain-length determining protein [Ralstonia condita]|nr:chain-length determining protein [Ralstonia sp. LMG 7141]
MIEEQMHADENRFGTGLDDVGAFIRRHALKLAAFTTIGAGAAFAATFMMRPLWQAQVTVQSGQLYWVTSTGPTVVNIEPPARTVDRLKVATFQDTVLKQLKLPLNDGMSPETDLIRRSFEVRLLRNSDLIELSVRGYSPSDASHVLEQYVRNLAEEHASLAKPTLDRLSNDMRQVEADLSEARARQAELERREQERSRTSIAGKFSESVLLDSMVSSTASDIRLLQQRKNTLQEQLNPERTFNTRVVGETVVSRAPVFPKRSLFSASGGGHRFVAWVDLRRFA